MRELSVDCSSRSALLPPVVGVDVLDEDRSNDSRATLQKSEFGGDAAFDPVSRKLLGSGGDDSAP